MSSELSYFEAAGYENLSLLGKGSDARVWLVRDLKFGHIRALKVLNKSVGEDLSSSDSFFRECALLLRICNGGHPNIVRIGRPRVVMGRAMVEMQYIHGRTLTQYIHEDMHFVPYNEILAFIHDIGGALSYCHAEGYKWMMAPGEDRKMSDEELIAHYGVAHNDLHSSNVMRRSDNNSYTLLDFGLAIQDGVAVRSSMRNEGHPEYRAPEKFEAKMGGKQGDIRVDVYAFGVLLFEMLTGDTPFHAEPGDLETGKIYRLHKEAPVPEIEPLRKAVFEKMNPGKVYVRDYPKWLDNMVRKCLAKEPDSRYSDMSEFMKEFKTNVSIDEKQLSRRMDMLRKEKGDLAAKNSELLESIKRLQMQVELLKKTGKIPEQKVSETSVNIKEVTKKSATVPSSPAAIPSGAIPDPDTKNETPSWKNVLLGVLPMAAFGALSAAAGNGDVLDRLPFWNHPDGPDPESEDTTFLDTASLGSIPVASSVNDSSSFSKAFAAARHEVGPGGFFMWKGEIYSTYTSEEWSKLSPEQKEAFEEGARTAEFGEDDHIPDTDEENIKEFVPDVLPDEEISPVPVEEPIPEEDLSPESEPEDIYSDRDVIIPKEESGITNDDSVQIEEVEIVDGALSYGEEESGISEDIDQLGGDAL